MSKKREEKSFQFTADCFTLAFTVYPQIAMIRENALKLATHLGQHTDLTDIHMGDESWVFQRPQARQGQRGMIRVKVDNDSEVEIEHNYPNGGLERFEFLIDKVLQSLGPVVSPQMVLGNIISLAYVADIGGDTRKILLGSLGLTGEGLNKVGVFKRPCHSVGLRLGFPPYRVQEIPNGKQPTEEKPDDTEHLMDRLTASDEDDEDDDSVTESIVDIKGADWQSTLTLQTLTDEPSKLWIEVNGQWVPPLPWKQFTKATTERLRTVDDFLRKQTTEFLEHFRSDR